MISVFDKLMCWVVDDYKKYMPFNVYTKCKTLEKWYHLSSIIGSYFMLDNNNTKWFFMMLLTNACNSKVVQSACSNVDTLSSFFVSVLLVYHEIVIQNLHKRYFKCNCLFCWLTKMFHSKYYFWTSFSMQTWSWFC